MFNVNHKLSLFRGDICELVVSIIVFQDDNVIRIDIELYELILYLENDKSEHIY